MKNSGRRSFLKKAAVLSTVSVVPALSGCSSGKKINNLSGMFTHHVFFWLKEAGNEQVKTDFRKALEKLASIKTVRFKHIGTPAATDRPVIDNTYTFSLLLMFDDQQGHDVYQAHPVHNEFREKYADWWIKVLVYDIV